MTLFVFDFIPEISLEAMRALVRGKLFKVRDCYTAHDSYLCTVSILLYPRCTGSDCTFLGCEFGICIRCREMMRPAWFCKNKNLFFKYSMFFFIDQPQLIVCSSFTGFSALSLIIGFSLAFPAK